MVPVAISARTAGCRLKGRARILSASEILIGVIVAAALDTCVTLPGDIIQPGVILGQARSKIAIDSIEILRFLLRTDVARVAAKATSRCALKTPLRLKNVPDAGRV